MPSSVHEDLETADPLVHHIVETTYSGTVYVVDDDASIRRLFQLLAEKLGLQAVSYDSAEAFLAAYRCAGPACLVLDLTLGGMDGLTLQKQIAAVDPDLAILVVSGTTEIARAVRAVKNGATDFVPKPFDYKKVTELIQACLGESLRRSMKRQAGDTVRQALAALTPREREVMRLVVAGHSNRQIAESLAISIKTVEAHRAHLMEKLAAGNIADLVRIAIAQTTVSQAVDSSPARESRVYPD
jgi:two-component system, LuxR family, response regulator FixJ